MNIVFMGTPQFAAQCLQSLIDAGENILAVLTKPDTPVGRKRIITPPQTKVVAEANGIDVYQPENIKTDEVFNIINDLKPDLIVVVAYGKILPQTILDIPKHGCVNVHASLLPKYRGAAPIQWAIINGEKVSGVTTMFMSKGLDEGDIIKKYDYAISEEINSKDLFSELATIGANAIVDTVALLKSGDFTRVSQNHNEASFAPIIKKEDARIDFNRSATEVHNLIRGMNPWPVAFTPDKEGNNIKIYKSRVVQISGKIGEIIDSDRFIVGCANGAVEFLEVLPMGGKIMSGEDYMRRFKSRGE